MSVRSYSDAQAEITLTPGTAADTFYKLVFPGPCHAYPIDESPSWSAYFIGGRELRQVGAAIVSVQLSPSNERAAPLHRGQEFELRSKGVAVARGRITRCWHGCARDGVHAIWTEEAFRSEVLPALSKVFVAAEYEWGVSLEGSSLPFQPSVAVRSVLWCISSFLEPQQCQAFAEGARTIRDGGLFLWGQEAGTSENALQSFPCCGFPVGTRQDIDEFVAYYATNYVPVGTAIFSATGHWGAVSFGSAHFAVVGGTAAFMEAAFAELGTTPEAQGLKFLLRGYEGNMWLHDRAAGVAQPRCAWVPELMEHLYGPERAARLIDEALAEERRRQ